MNETKQKDDRETGETTRHADFMHAPVVKTWPLNNIDAADAPGVPVAAGLILFNVVKPVSYAGAHPRPNIGFRLFSLYFSSSLSDWAGSPVLLFFFSLFRPSSPHLVLFSILKGIVSYIAPCLYINTAVTFSLGEPTLIFKLIPRAHSPRRLAAAIQHRSSV